MERGSEGSPASTCELSTAPPMRARPTQRATSWTRIEVFMVILLSLNDSLVPFPPRIDSDLDLRGAETKLVENSWPILRNFLGRCEYSLGKDCVRLGACVAGLPQLR